MSDLTELARRIAATGRWTPRLGTVVIGDGTRFRVVRDGADDSRILADAPIRTQTTWVLTQLFDAHADECPDLTDEVTALSLLADLPEHDLVRHIGGHWGCYSSFRPTIYQARATPVEAIAQAWIAAHGGPDE